MKKQLYVEIGNRLREKRESVGYTREKLAELADLSSRFIANIELGDNGVSIETLKKLCELLGVSSDYILWGVEEQIAEITGKLAHLDARYHKLLGDVIQKFVEAVALAENR